MFPRPWWKYFSHGVLHLAMDSWFLGPQTSLESRGDSKIKWIMKTVIFAFGGTFKGCDWIRLIFAHRFPLNSRAPIASFIKPKTFVMATYGAASSYTLMLELAQLMGAPFIKTYRWAQSSPYPVIPFTIGPRNKLSLALHTDHLTVNITDLH